MEKKIEEFVNQLMIQNLQIPKLFLTLINIEKNFLNNKIIELSIDSFCITLLESHDY